MKFKIILFLNLILFSFLLKSQDVTLNSSTNKTSVSRCGNYFYDPGGASGSYGKIGEQWMTICSDGSTGSHVELSFEEFDVSNFDLIKFYDGQDTLAPLITEANNSVSLADVKIYTTAGNPSGCMTIKIIAKQDQSAGAGWKALISCSSPCQSVIAQLTSPTSPVIDADGYIKLCPGQSVNFQGQGSYPQNGTFYQQNNTTSTFKWDCGAQSSTTQTANFVFNDVGEYVIKFKVTDVNGCKSLNDIGVRVRTATGLVFPGVAPSPVTICPGENTDLIGSDIRIGGNGSGYGVAGVPYTQEVKLGVAETMFLPDGSGVSYNSTLSFDAFSVGQTLTKAADIINVCSNIEHTYLRDLEIKLTCPNGSSVTLVERGPTTVGRVQLGEPICCDDPGVPGIGYDYCFNSSCDSTMVQIGVKKDYRHAFKEKGTNLNVPREQCMESGMVMSGSPLTTIPYVPAGCYKPYQDFSALVGCPLNGDWVLTVKDGQTNDNGYIFSWQIEFNQTLLPDAISYSSALDPTTMYWEAVSPETSTSFITSANNKNATVQPASVGRNVQYKLYATDDFGCQYDTTVTVTVRAINDPVCVSMQLSNTTTPEYCGQNNGTANLNISGTTGPYNITWSPIPGAGQGTQSVSGLSAGSYTVTVVDNPTTLVKTQIINITSYGDLTASVSKTDIRCFGGSDGTATASYGGSQTSAPYTYLWSNNSTNTSINGLSAGNYTVTITDNYGCTASASTIIAQPTQINASILSQLDPLCYNGSDGRIEATATGGTGNNYTYSWQPIGGNNALAISLSAGTYTVTVSDVNLCTSTAQATLNNPGVFSASITSTTPEICDNGKNGSATVEVNGGTSPYSYSWGTVPAQQANSTLQTTNTATGLSSGAISVTVTDRNLCSIIESETILLESSPIITISSEGERCGIANGAATVAVQAGTGKGPFEYNWNNGSTINAISSLTAGTYWVTVTDANACRKINNVTIKKLNLINADFYSNYTKVDVLNPTINFYADCDSALTWEWNFGDGVISDEENPIHTYPEEIPRFYEVKLLATDRYGCEDSIIKIIKVEEKFTIYIPSSFSPNGDSKNENWGPKVTFINETDYSLRIYNRLGALIFYTDSPFENWNGRVNNNSDEVVLDGVYIYYITLKEINGVPHEYSGSITLMK